MRSYAELFAEVERVTAVSLSVVNTGGNSCAAHGRLPNGQWLVITEADDFLSATARDRLRAEEQHGTPSGWFVGIYDNECDGSVNYPAGPQGCRFALTDEDAPFEDLPSVIARTLTQYEAPQSVSRT